jgi:hypothetical protein
VVSWRASVVVLLVLNGAGTAPAAAIHAPMAADEATHAGHHPAGPAVDAVHEHGDAPVSFGDCCDDTGCDCGCAVQQFATPPGNLARGDRAAWLPEFAFVVKSFHSSPRNAPYRPPA